MSRAAYDIEDERRSWKSRIAQLSLSTWPTWVCPALATGVLTLYAAFPTRNYYWDGISFALAIESAERLSASLLHPNHLIYNGIGYVLWSGVRTLGFDLRALVVLQTLNIMAAIAAVWFLHRLLLRITHSAYLATSLTALFAFSSTWWKFATDANAYILATLALIVAAYLAYTSKRPRPALIGFVHACGMLVHQLAAIFSIPLAVYIYRKYGLRGLMRYAAVAGVITVSVYGAAFRLSQGTWKPSAFVWWLTSHSPEVSFSFDFISNATVSALSYVRLFVGGRANLVEQFLGPFVLVVVACLGIVVVKLLLQFRGRWKDVRLFYASAVLDSEVWFPILWVAGYAVFLFFWLPNNTFYKLFLLPGIIVFLAQVLAKYSGPRRYRLALFTAAVALANLAFSIFPYSHVEANQPLGFALGMQHRWSDRTVVYYASFTPDNWLIRYFNPATSWKEMKSGDPTGFEREITQDIRSGYEVWIDTTAADTLAQNTAIFSSHQGAVRELVNSRHRIRFVRWRPPEEAADSYRP